MKISIVTPIYNNIELCDATINSIIDNTYYKYEYILVDCHSPDIRSRDLIREIAKANKNIKILDLGYNLGCHEAINKGFEQSQGDYLIKLDDDTRIITKDWDKHIIELFEKYNNNEIKKLAFIAPNCNVRHGATIEYISKYNFEKIVDGIIGFSCIIIPKKIFKKFGPLAPSSPGSENRLYGGEELYYANIAKANNMDFGYYLNVTVEHADNTFRDPDYILWKLMYGFWGIINIDLVSLKNRPDLLKLGYLRLIKNELNNNWLRELGIRRMNELGN